MEHFKLEWFYHYPHLKVFEFGKGGFKGGGANGGIICLRGSNHVIPPLAVPLIFLSILDETSLLFFENLYLLSASDGGTPRVNSLPLLFVSCLV